MASAWVDQIFDAKAAKRGGLVRRKKASVSKFASEADLIAAVKARGFHLIESGDQYLIFCHKGSMKLIV